MKPRYLIGFLIFAGSRARADVKPFADLYAEGVYLGSVNTMTGLVNARGGVTPMPGLETYGVARFGADTRTFLESSDNVYDDNYLFVGAGVDDLSLLPGVRLLAQFGYSTDLSSKIHLGGFDIRTGVVSYHEIRWPCGDCINEFYTESLYIHRYRNLMLSPQWRFFWEGWKGHLGNVPFGAGPLVTLVVGDDTQNYDYNRFAEVRAGARFRMMPLAGLSLAPQYVWGRRWSTGAGYAEWRVLISAYVAF